MLISLCLFVFITLSGCFCLSLMMLLLHHSSVDALTLICVINWEDLLSRSLPSPPVIIHASPPAPLLPLLFSSSFHQTLTLLSHLHSLNQLLQLTLVIPFHFIPSLFPSRSLSLCLSHLPQLPSDHAASMNL